jgi:hypothetical protein
MGNDKKHSKRVVDIVDIFRSYTCIVKENKRNSPTLSQYEFKAECDVLFNEHLSAVSLAPDYS